MRPIRGGVEEARHTVYGDELSRRIVLREHERPAGTIPQRLRRRAILRELMRGISPRCPRAECRADRPASTSKAVPGLAHRVGAEWRGLERTLNAAPHRKRALRYASAA